MEGQDRPPTDPGRGPDPAPQDPAPPDPAYQTGPQALDPEGQRAWLAQVDRQLKTRTYIGAAAAVLALAAGIVAIVLAIDARDKSASTADVQRLERELTVVAEDASGATEAQDNIDSLSDRVDSLEGTIEDAVSEEQGTNRRLNVIEDELEDLRQQISDLESDLQDSGN
jgi:septal ring factor EnvC (AmiA/AmiB activator)